MPFTSFALFLGVAMSITAFPVLARILTDRRMLRTELGAIALSCAATDDVTAWCLLAFVVGVAQAHWRRTSSRGRDPRLHHSDVLAGPAAPAARDGTLGHGTAAAERRRFRVRRAASLALATEYIGIHAIFGAFLLGAIIPHDSLVARTFTRHLEAVVTILFLPAFFAFTGMRTRIDLVSGMDQWLLCGLIVVVATGANLGVPSWRPGLPACAGVRPRPSGRS